MGIMGLGRLCLLCIMFIVQCSMFNDVYAQDAQIIIGGACINESFKDEISADGYSADAAEAVKLVQRLLR